MSEDRLIAGVVLAAGGLAGMFWCVVWGVVHWWRDREMRDD